MSWTQILFTNLSKSVLVSNFSFAEIIQPPYCGQPKAHLCNNHAIFLFSILICHTCEVDGLSRQGEGLTNTDLDRFVNNIWEEIDLLCTHENGGKKSVYNLVQCILCKQNLSMLRRSMQCIYIYIYIYTYTYTNTCMCIYIQENMLILNIKYIYK